VPAENKAISRYSRFFRQAETMAILIVQSGSGTPCPPIVGAELDASSLGMLVARAKLDGALVRNHPHAAALFAVGIGGALVITHLHAERANHHRFCRFVKNVHSRSPSLLSVADPNCRSSSCGL
jgi:hypothetical protein